MRAKYDDLLCDLREIKTLIKAVAPRSRRAEALSACKMQARRRQIDHLTASEEDEFATRWMEKSGAFELTKLVMEIQDLLNDYLEAPLVNDTVRNPIDEWIPGGQWASNSNTEIHRSLK